MSEILKLFAWDKPHCQSHSGASTSGKQQNSSTTSSLKPKVIKLNFRDIKEIDTVSSSYYQIQELSLNHNHLRSLDRIEQFTNLRSLHLNFNQLRS